jgi:hypothetical protein
MRPTVRANGKGRNNPIGWAAGTSLVPPAFSGNVEGPGAMPGPSYRCDVVD